MATRIYFLKKGQSNVSVAVSPVSIGVTSSVAKLKKSGGTVIDVGDSGRDATGTIARAVIGKSNDLLASALVITTIVNLTAVPKTQWNSVFENLRISYKMSGGIDGPQDFNVDNDDKTQILDGQLIVVTKAIKFDINANPPQ
jgi:hypothetical protein